MTISPISIQGLPSAPPTVKAAEGGGDSFAGMVKGALNEINQTQATADSAVQNFVSGNGTDVHQVMLAMEQARMTLVLAVEARNKVVEAYQELARMPV